MKRSASIVEVIVASFTILALVIGQWVMSREQAARHEMRLQHLEGDALEKSGKIDRIDQNTQEIRIPLERKQDIKP